MKYDFTTILDRKGKDALAVDAVGMHNWGNEPEAPKDGFDFIPMWVADMNFATCPSIIETICERLKHPTFGYFSPRKEYFDSIIEWQKKRNKVTGLKPEYIGYENGVHGFVSSVVDVFSEPGEAILLHSPVYVGFASDVEWKGRVAVYSELKQDENGIWRMNYEDMDRKLKEHNIHLAIFCSPHNPCGRVWERWELEKAMEVYEKNDCYVMSDEIWADMTYSGHQHIPTQMTNDWAKEHTVSVYATSKTFNLAGMIASYHIIYNKYLKDRITKHSHSTHYNEMNVLGMYATIGAYRAEGHEWLDELMEVLKKNCKHICNCLNEQIDGTSVSMPQGTYMVFVDCTEYCKRTGMSLDEIIQKGWDVGIGWQDGRKFGGRCHIRMNLAVPFSQIEKVCDRLVKYVFDK
mgnify:CR=1 FL=1